MTIRRTFSRSLAAFSMFFTLATGAAIAAAPSTAHAEVFGTVWVDDADFMDYTDDVGEAVATPQPAGDAAGAANARTLRPASTPVNTTTSVPTTRAPGIIMRDGGVCDPIRHMGC